MAGEMEVTLRANLTADPELAEVGGKTVARVQLAHNTRTKRGGEWSQDEAWFMQGTVWPRFDDDQWPANVASSLTKGMPVIVTGRLKREPWESRDGRSGIAYRLQVTEIAPVLQNATAQVTKANRQGGGGQQQGSNWGQAQGQQAWGQSATGGQAQQPTGGGEFAGGFDDDQPF